MSIFRKKEIPQDSPADIKRRELLYKHYATFDGINDRINKILIYKTESELFLEDSVEHKNVQALILENQMALRNAIAAYDEARKTYMDYVQAHADEFVTTVDWFKSFVTSEEFLYNRIKERTVKRGF